MQENIETFELDENGEIIYSGDLEPEAEDEVIEDVGDISFENNDEGDLLEGPEDVPETGVEIEEGASQMVIPLTDDGLVPVVLSEEVTAAILADTPAGGVLGSSTLDYFDRVVSSLPADYVYVAYRISSESSYDGVLYYGDHFVVEDDHIEFGADSVQLSVFRVSSSGYNAVTEYDVADAEGAFVSLSRDSDVVYYTNAVVGYPLLGGIVRPVGSGVFLVTGLLSAVAVVVLQKLMLKK